MIENIFGRFFQRVLLMSGERREEWLPVGFFFAFCFQSQKGHTDMEISANTVKTDIPETLKIVGDLSRCVSELKGTLRGLMGVLPYSLSKLPDREVAQMTRADLHDLLADMAGRFRA